MYGNIYHGDELIAKVFEEFGGYTVLTLDDGQKHFYETKVEAIAFIKEIKGEMAA